jgi:GT2 family glycosyltransferase
MQIIIGIATTGSKERFETLALTVDSLNNNTIKPDHIHVYDNSKESVDYSDLAKFYFLKQYDEPIYYFSCDDDILYPKTYIEDMINAIEKHKTIVTHHGRILNKLDVNYYNGGHKPFACLHQNLHERLIDVAGTGVTAFRTDYFNPVDLYKQSYKFKRMSDIVFSYQAAKQNKFITILPHSKGYFKDLSKGQTDSCYLTERRNTINQTFLCNLIIKLKI